MGTDEGALMYARFLLFVVAAGCVDPVVLPAPTGPNAIGRTTVRLVDVDRDEVMTADRADRREATVHVWYPAARRGADVAEYVADLDLLAPALDRRSERLFRHVEGHTAEDPPPAAPPAGFPVVALSHGNDLLGAQYTFLAEELVSRGFAVVAVDHPYDARAVSLSSGTAVGFLDEAWPQEPPPADGIPDPDSPAARMYRSRVEVRATDVSFVLDQLAAADPTAALGDGTPRLDLERVVFVGHSVGGVAAGSFCQGDPRAAGCVNLDGDSGHGPFYLGDDGEGFDPPFLMITKPFDVSDAQLEAWGLSREAWLALLAEREAQFFGAVTGGSYRVSLDGAEHMSFTDEPFLLAALEGDAERLARHEAHLRWVRAYLVAFVARQLGVGDGEDPGALLDAPPEAGVTVSRWPPHTP